MGTNNHLLATVVRDDGSTKDLDIQFELGDVREHIYRVGDKLILTENELDELQFITVVPGIAINWQGEQQTRLGTEIMPNDYRYFRIVVVESRIISFAPTTAEDFDALELKARGEK